MANGREERLLAFREKRLKIIKCVLDEHDPMGLLSSGCPFDEYSSEVNLIETAMSEAEIENIIDLSDIIYNVFLRQFDEKLDKAVCKQIASDINKKLSD